MKQSKAMVMLSAAALYFVGTMSAWAQAPPAAIGLSAGAEHPAVIVGGATHIQALVSNTAPAGSKDLNYTVQFQLPYGTLITNPNTLMPGQQRGWQQEFDTQLIPQPLELGPYVTTVVVSDPNASNSPQSRAVTVDVLGRARPLFVIPTAAGMPPQLIEEPTISPEQFAATGGGESFAAAAPHIVGGSNSPTARLDFDTLGEAAMGAPQITARNVNFFSNMPPLEDGQDPLAVGISPFDVYLDASRVGTFSKTFVLGFSDEDIPGARPTGSVQVNLTYTFHVVPEPVGAAMILLGTCMLAIRLRCHRSEWVKSTA
jgi:hypothetical protein